MNNKKFSDVINPCTVTADRLSDGESLEIKRNAIKDRKHLSFTCDLKSLGDGKIIIGHGYEITSASWAEITADSVSAYSFFGFRNPPHVELLAPTEHRIKIESTLSVLIDFDQRIGASVVIASVGGMFKAELKDWTGQDGNIFVRPVGCSLESCKLNWSSDSYRSRVWVMGDSYIGHRDPSRWPYYLYRDGYADLLLAGFSGMPTERGLEEFKNAISMGNPEFCLWCLGMNNGDSKEDGSINKGWLSSTEDFLAICKERGIVPILSTIPSTPKVNNNAKNEWVRASGYRYIDFSRAVGADKDVNWYEGMLFTDLVHPAKSGAQALYMQVLTDFPEIMQRGK